MQTVISSLTEKIMLAVYGPVETLEDIGTYVMPDGRELSSARDLYEYLKLAPSQFKRWCNSNIEDNAFAVVGTDYERFDVHVKVPNGGHKAAAEYAIHPDFAAKLCMVSKKSERAEEVRNFFVARNKKLASIEQGQTQVALADSQDDLILMLAQRNADNSRRLRALEAERADNQQRIGAVEQQVAQVVAKVTTVQTDFYTVAGWASLQKKKVPISEANVLGKRAANLSKAQGIEVGRVPDQRFGTVNAYHVDILKQVLPLPPGQSVSVIQLGRR
jgi:anti-repressor protein